jgi:hypothetical protein
VQNQFPILPHLQANSQSWSTVFLTHTSSMSLCSSRHWFADPAALQCLLRYPHIVRCQPMCSWLDMAFSRSLHCVSCTLLKSSITISGDLSQDLMHFVNISYTGQRSFCCIFFSIRRTRSYHLLLLGTHMLAHQDMLKGLIWFMASWALVWFNSIRR